ncbi:bifunctional 3'-5' exonuclease/DNA polymerase [Arthrobacter sp. H5]|uniref:bifunctional 3'-5' exonuclease/DNA polymerase n=1 Tax=Arthrobacter sp. H5 TaxID=1267973 RepID=UPI000482746F|nr:bifunctional 3'-5' exonuclease/DNA polymerase [Arthrobacter sp. H5]
MYIVLAAPTRSGETSDDSVAQLQPADSSFSPAGDAVVVNANQLPEAVRRFEAEGVRWVWEETRAWYPSLLDQGVTIERCHDVSLSREILRHSLFSAHTPYSSGLGNHPDDADDPALPRQLPPAAPSPLQGSLFEADSGPAGPGCAEVLEEFAGQQHAAANSSHPQRLALLLAAESAGALLAAEMEAAGIPWRADVHEQLLVSQLGPRPREGLRPVELERLAGDLRDALDNPRFNPDSPQELLRALHRAGIEVSTTRSWELERQEHPAIEPLLKYKKLSRLLTANGWTWLDTWVSDGRFRPEYVVGGVVSGRWASRGGGALQIPKQIRDAVRPDPGYAFIVADAAQLEPRVLAALGQDSALATAARGLDLYQGIADQGFGDRAKAKIAMLGAMYGATTGESGRLMPQLARTYPQAIGVVESAARTGEAGGVVSSYLGRGCPPASERWLATQRTSTAEEQRRADNIARSRGRFTRNFVVQATAAEWALCWLAELRRRLRQIAVSSPGAELVFFLHDEVMLHVPEAMVTEVSRMVTEAAVAATRLMFGDIPIEFTVNLMVVDSYALAK